MTPKDDLLLERWGQLHDAKKIIFGWPDWHTRKSRRSSKAEFTLESDLADEQELFITLADENGITIEDVQLRFSVRKESIENDVTVTLEVADNGWTAIARMDFWPTGTHSNKFWRKLGQPSVVSSSHHHRFHDNKRLGMEAFKPSGNLDSAIPFETEPQSFRDILRLVGVEWNVDGLDELPPPEHQRKMI